MANKKIKGLTIELDGDTTKLGKALESVNKKSSDLSSELGEVNRLLRLDPGNAELLAQKQKILAEAVDNTADRLKTLKEAERQVQAQFERGEVSEDQVRALRREIVATEGKLNSYKNAVKDTANALKDMADKAEANTKMADLLGRGLMGAGALAGAAVTGLTAVAESTKAYRTEMGKLDTAFTTNGHTSEAATGAYRELVGVLGETDQAVETANHLAVLTDNEKDLATWTGDILPGVFATFGASLPIEGLTEAANETAKVGAVTGPLADALNWAGVSEDAFNESLAKCTTEQERQALITKTLNDLYGEASTKYKETNADVIAANEANERWTASLAAVGEKVTPLVTEVKDLGATLLEKVVPVIDFVSDNLPAVAVSLAGVTAAMVAFKLAALAATAAQSGQTLATYILTAAQSALNVVMMANPIGLIILAITALVAAFMVLWKNCEGFREFWKNLWDGIKNVVNVVVEWVKKNWQSMVLFLISPLAGIFKYLMDNCKGFRDFWTKMWAGLKNTVNTVVEWVKKNWKSLLLFLVSPLAGIFKILYDNFEGFRKKVNSVFSAVKTTFFGFINTLKALPGRVWSAIVGAVNRVAQWGRDMAAKAKNGATSLVNNVVNGVKSLPSKMREVGKNLVQGLWNGIKDTAGWVKSKISGFATGVLDDIKRRFGVASPSKETAWIGEMLDEGLAKGVEDNAKKPLDAMASLSSGMLTEAELPNGVTLQRQLNATFAPPTVASSGVDVLLGKLDGILTAIKAGHIIAIDGDRLVGATADKFDSRLGMNRVLAERGAK